MQEEQHYLWGGLRVERKKEKEKLFGALWFYNCPLVWQKAVDGLERGEKSIDWLFFFSFSSRFSPSFGTIEENTLLLARIYPKIISLCFWPLCLSQRLSKRDNEQVQWIRARQWEEGKRERERERERGVNKSLWIAAWSVDTGSPSNQDQLCISSLFCLTSFKRLKGQNTLWLGEGYRGSLWTSKGTTGI